VQASRCPQMDFRKLARPGLGASLCYDSLPGAFMKLFLLGALFASSIFFAVQSQQSTQTQRIPLFENDDVKVWKSVIFPDAPLAMHRHEHPRVIVAMTDGTMKIVEQNGPAESHVWETGKAYWLPANPPNTMHADVNAGDKPIEVVVVELKKEN
jgi:beta-alanine degradation protein BauB